MRKYHFYSPKKKSILNLKICEFKTQKKYHQIDLMFIALLKFIGTQFNALYIYKNKSLSQVQRTKDTSNKMKKIYKKKRKKKLENTC